MGVVVVPESTRFMLLLLPLLPLSLLLLLLLLLLRAWLPKPPVPLTCGRSEW